MGSTRRKLQWIIISCAAASAVILGYWGLYEHFARQGEPRAFWDIAYSIIYLFVIESGETSGPVPWQLTVARWLAAGVSFWAIVKTALLLFNERLQSTRPGRWRNHVVICGIGRKGIRLIEEFRAAGWRVVAIERNVYNPHISHCRELGAIVFVGNAANTTLLSRAGAARARHVVAITADDGANVAVAMKLHKLLKRKRAHWTHPITCLVHVVDLHLCALLKQHSLFRDETDQLDVRVFNIYENAARMLIAEHPLEGISKEDHLKAPHLVILGFGRMGESIALQAAKTGHYASGKPMRVTVIDHDAEHVRNMFFGRYPHYPQICKTEFIHAEIGGADTIGRLIQWALEPAHRVTLVLCLDEDAQSLSAAMRLAAQFRGLAIPLYVRMSQATGLAALFEDEQGVSGWLNNVHPFAMISQTCQIATVIDDKLDTLARAIHKACAEQRRERQNHSPHVALPPWEQDDSMFRDSYRQQADHIPVKLRAIGCEVVTAESPGTSVSSFGDDEVELLAKMEHERWNAERLLAGWTLGPLDAERRTNPYLVAWAELPEEIREIVRNAVRTIPALLESIGQKVIRL